MSLQKCYVSPENFELLILHFLCNFCCQGVLFVLDKWSNEGLECHITEEKNIKHHK